MNVFRSRLTVGQRTLNPFIFVRVEAPELKRVVFQPNSDFQQKRTGAFQRFVLNCSHNTSNERKNKLMRLSDPQFTSAILAPIYYYLKFITGWRINFRNKR